MIKLPDEREIRVIDDQERILWAETRLGFWPQECALTGKFLWPYTKVAKKVLTYVAVGRVGIWNRAHYARLDQAMIENLQVK